MYPNPSGQTKLPQERRHPVSGPATDDPRLTEARNPRTAGIDTAETADVVRMIQAEDRAVPLAVESQAAEIAAAVDAIAARFRRGGRLVFVGAGTSGRLGVLDASECPPTFGTDPSRVVGVIAGGSDALVRSSEGAEDDPAAGAAAIAALDAGADDFVLGIATSGTTPFVHGALEEAARRGAATGFLCCSAPPARVADLVDHLIVPLVGPEVVAGSTRLKAGTATKLVLNTLTTAAMIRTGRVYENLMVDLRARSAKLADRGIRIVARAADVDRETARRLLIAAGGSAKTAIAMRLLGVDRARAERALDAVDGFLREAVERVDGGTMPDYALYPPAPAAGELDGLIEALAAAPRGLREASELADRTDRAGDRVPVRADGWSAARHAAHLVVFEREAVTPRVREWVSRGARGEPFPGWSPGPVDEPEGGFEGACAELEAERGRTLSLLRDLDPEAEATVGGERITLYQFLRGVVQHDAAHATRVAERVHPALLVPVSDR